MKVYLAARFTRRAEIAGYAQELEAAGIHITSSWLESDEVDIPRPTIAVRDITDIMACDLLVEFTAQDPPYRGGHIWESGFACGLDREVVTVGPKENVFHEILKNFPTWEKAKEYIVERADSAGTKTKTTV